MRARESECDVCGAELPSKRETLAGQLDLCTECSADFEGLNLLGCCAPASTGLRKERAK